MDATPMEIRVVLVDEEHPSSTIPANCGLSSVGSSANGGTSNIGTTVSGTFGHSAANILPTGDTGTHSTTGAQSSSSNPSRASVMASAGGKRKQNISLKDVNAPKVPLSGYLLFLSANRKAIRLKNPGLPFLEITKLLGTMWSELPMNVKQVYLDQAEKDKKQYAIEVEKYQKSDAYKTFVEEREKAIKVLKQEAQSSPGSHLVCIPCNRFFDFPHNLNEHLRGRKHRSVMEQAQARDRKSKKSAATVKQVVNVETVGQEKTPTQGVQASGKTPSSAQGNDFPDMSAIAEGDLNVPVFSESFLHYNKGRESELRKLRKATMVFEEQNAILSKHIDNLQSAIGKLEDEKSKSEQDIKGLEPFLKNFSDILVRTFSDVRLPNNSDVVPTESSVGEFLVQLSKVCEQSTDSATVQKVKEVLNDLDYPNCLDN